MKIRLIKKVLKSKNPYWVQRRYIVWQMVCCNKYPAGVDNRIAMAMNWYLKEERKKREKSFYNLRWTSFNAYGKYLSPYAAPIMPLLYV